MTTSLSARRRATEYPHRNTKMLVAFFGLTFVISWLLWLPSVFRSMGLVELPAIVGLPAMFASFGPGAAAFILTARAEGRAGVSRLARRGVDFSFSKGWLIPIVFLMPVIYGLAYATITLIQGSDFAQDIDPLMLAGVLVYILFLGGPLGEEFGWRGYALPRIQARWNALVSSLLLGLFWGVWHLPLFFISTSSVAQIPILEFMALHLVLSVIYTWVFNNTGGSVLAVILLHTFSNLPLFPWQITQQGRYVGFAIVLIVAMVLVLFWGAADLSRGKSGNTEPHIER